MTFLRPLDAFWNVLHETATNGWIAVKSVVSIYNCNQNLDKSKHLSSSYCIRLVGVEVTESLIKVPEAKKKLI